MCWFPLSPPLAGNADQQTKYGNEVSHTFQCETFFVSIKTMHFKYLKNIRNIFYI